MRRKKGAEFDAAARAANLIFAHVTRCKHILSSTSNIAQDAGCKGDQHLLVKPVPTIRTGHAVCENVEAAELPAGPVRVGAATSYDRE
ncbi:hypothetical protein [Bradyrhizobium elkanii]|uniref:hypothetical protein n=1 Tax=Bradyrhizobium elkanii TaxID=29448 RepID=UPI00339A9976